MQSIEDICLVTLQIVKKNMRKPSYETWMKSTTAQSHEGNTFIISAPNNYVRDWLEKSYSQ
ncbi:DnaA N-terminal domain-containing protein, partial [Listeria monocytogenes]|uniref:DnaA N-terminal domain-containing protein n=1 Tax=Listeria monocytogenes TaxID=1639 RepID=UPI000D9E48C3